MSSEVGRISDIGSSNSIGDRETGRDRMIIRNSIPVSAERRKEKKGRYSGTRKIQLFVDLIPSRQLDMVHPTSGRRATLFEMQVTCQLAY